MYSSFLIQIFLSLVLSLNRLAKAASSKAQENKETVITDRHIKMVVRVSLGYITPFQASSPV